MALTVHVGDELMARAIAQELIWLTTVELEPDGQGWRIALDRLVHLDHVLASVRAALRGRPGAFARVVLNGTSYVLEGDAG
jgi:hypothetical protein